MRYRWEEGGQTSTFSTAHRNTTTLSGLSYFQGLAPLSKSPTWFFFGGAEDGIAARPEAVIVAGLEEEKSERR
jgi:hypothetical protein